MKNHSKKPLKVAVIGYKLDEGGLERVFGSTTKMLHDAGIEMHTLVLEDKIDYEFAGKLVTFGKYSKFVKYFKRVWGLNFSKHSILAFIPSLFRNSGCLIKSKQRLKNSPLVFTK